MEERVSAITWEAPSHHHIEKSRDWFWAVGLLALAGAAGAFITGNILFGLVILLGAATMIVFALHEPKIIPFAVTTRGVRIRDELYPYTSLVSYFIDAEHPQGTQLLLRSKKNFMPLLIIPIPDEYVHDIENLIASHIGEEHLEEPLSHKILEFFGF